MCGNVNGLGGWAGRPSRREISRVLNAATGCFCIPNIDEIHTKELELMSYNKVYTSSL